MHRKIELLAPGGDIDAIKAAIAAGADAIYCGLNQFNARNRAANINIEDLNGVIHLAHKKDCKIFLTLNIIIVESEIPSLFKLLNKLINTCLDGVIVQDLGLFYILSRYFKRIDIHASTQMNTHNQGQIKFISRLNACRVNLSREMSIQQIKAVTKTCIQNKISTEVFVHGSYCLAFSGLCYMSSVQSGNSGNRGRCSQPCRDRYLQTPAGKNFPLNLKDNSAYSDLRLLSKAGVASIKIEGRIKKYEYVYTVVNSWRKQLDRFYDQNVVSSDNSDLYKVFNRDFSNSYLMGDIHKNMFIDNPRDNSVKHLLETKNYSTDEKKEEDHLKFYKRKKGFAIAIKTEIDRLSTAKIPLTIKIFGEYGSYLNARISTPDTTFLVASKNRLVKKKDDTVSKCLTHTSLLDKFKTINNTQYYLKHLELDCLEQDLFIPFKDITSIQKKVLSILNESKQMAAPIEVPFLKKEKPLKSNPTLTILISSKKDIKLCNTANTDVFFQLPNHMGNDFSKYCHLFTKYRKIDPWFPSILIGQDYTAAVKFLDQVKPGQIVTNNTGIAYEAWKREIPWIAGPYLNIANSFSLLCLKKKFKCAGSFVSSEMSKYQIKRIIRPKDFNLYYSVYHPVLLLTSRQCLMHQVTGCQKEQIDADCIKACQTSSSLTDMKNRSFYIHKSKGNYHSIYNQINCLNLDVMKDLPGFFSNFLIDLRDIKTKTEIKKDKSEIIDLFINLLNQQPDAEKEIQKVIYPSTNVQYENGF